jgi:uncharacterized repeat protein (TIGR04076 family)
MATMRDEVRVKVISTKKSNCPHNHQVGDEWILGETTPAGLCMGAFTTIFPHAWALMFGGSPPSSAGGTEDIKIFHCPDANIGVVFELTRLRK